MYWCKIATTEKEFQEIAALNYATFVEEIPQHPANEERLLVDKFHEENTYIILYKEQQFIGMIALRNTRPFSIDDKVGDVEQYLHAEDCAKLCEVRLLAIRQEHRTGRVFFRLAQALINYLFERHYTACVISGTVRQEKLYKRMGFEQFADAVGTEEARYLPMVLTRRNSEALRELLSRRDLTFYPGPVEQTVPLTNTNLSHRSLAFSLLLEEMEEWLLSLSKAHFVTTLVGTGTLANDAMLLQLKSDFPHRKGLILSNGEFGQRLIKQAHVLQLSFDSMVCPSFEKFNLQHIEDRLSTEQYDWLLYVHGETSTGMYNGADICELAQKHDVAVCADCISTFGALPYSLENYHLATAVSGKAIGALSGLAFVFSKEKIQASTAPLYLNLAYYKEQRVPFTLPAALVSNVVLALRHYPERYRLLKERMKMLEMWSFYEKYAYKTASYPMITTFKMPQKWQSLSDDLKLNGIRLHDESGYLRQNGFVQLSIIQPNFEQSFKVLCQMWTYYTEILE